MLILSVTPSLNQEKFSVDLAAVRILRAIAVEYGMKEENMVLERQYVFLAVGVVGQILRATVVD